MSAAQPFVHLHVHSEFSMLDGLCKLPALVARAKALNQPAIALTDHGGMYGAVHFYNAAKAAEIKPIIGCEVYMAKGSRFDKQVKLGSDQAHLTLLSTSLKGYQNLMHMVSVANLEGFSYKPRIDWETLQKYQEDVIVLSGCMNSPFNRLLRAEKIDEAKALFRQYKEVFGDRFYIELQNHPGIPELKTLNTHLVAIAREFQLELVATNDVHYVNADDANAQDALLCVQTRKLLSDTKRMSMIETPEFYLKSNEQMAELFSGYEEALKNTLTIADRCTVEIPTGKLVFPDFPMPKGETPETLLTKMAMEGLKKKFDTVTPDLIERLNYELKIINDKGYPTYFLITQDFVNWAKQQGIGVGPGRGSAAGSLVSYSLNITTINPLQHNLPFERFLNPHRPTPPDIDIDFADDRRDEVIQYAARKYGSDHVAQVITFGKMEARVAIRDIGRVLGMPYEDPDRIAKLIPNNPGKHTTLDDALAAVPELAEYYKQPKFKTLIDLAKKVEGTIRHSSVHAAAVIIADKALPNYTPIQTESKSGKTVTQYDMYALDCNVSDNAIGLLKFDFLGLRNLSIIQTALELIKVTKNVEIDIGKLPLDDKKTYDLLASGETTGVFQLESAGMRRVARTLRPNQFSDITAMVALYRPGPMDLIPQFIEGKHKPEAVVYPDPTLKPVLEETYGIMVYQEQIMQIANVMAGYSLGEADILRRAIGKKKKKLLDENKNIFKDRAAAKGYKKAVADKVWGFIETFANYGFNKAHAACYAMIAYETAYLKANYPVEYMAALMTVESNSHSATRDERVAVAIEGSKAMGITILPPEINKSDRTFSLEEHQGSLENMAIRFSLSAIKNVGDAAIENILNTRKEHGEFGSLTEFIHATDGRKTNKKVLECLIKVGAMDSFGNRASMLENLEQIRLKAAQFQSEIEGQDMLFSGVSQTSTAMKDTFPTLTEYPKPELLSFEKELLGLYLTDHPMAAALTLVAKRADKKIADLDPIIHNNQTFLFGGVITRLKQVTTKASGKPMAFGVLDDGSATAEFIVFPKLFAELGDKLQENVVVLIKAKAEVTEEEKKLIAERISFPTTGEAEQQQVIEAHEIFIPRKTEKETLQTLGKLLKANPGSDRVAIMIPNGGEPQRMLLPYGVLWSEKLEKEVGQLLQ